MFSPLSLAFADLSYVDPFIDQARFVLDRMFGLTTTAGKPRAKTEKTTLHDVTGLVPLHGAVQGKIGISLPGKLACALTSKLLQRNVLQLGNEVADVAGEIANTITGRAAATLAGAGVRIGLPEVVLGRNKPLEFGELVIPLVVPIETNAGALVLEIGLALNPSGAGSGFRCGPVALTRTVALR
jgi:CheY-specific phosphatase CheX